MSETQSFALEGVTVNLTPITAPMPMVFVTAHKGEEEGKAIIGVGHSQMDQAELAALLRVIATSIEVIATSIEEGT